jgi:DNA-binding LacI/PurR family transcriptional regulator
MQNVTIYDVAKRAGVSTATVSRVLNSPDRVTEETRAHVLSVIDELGFVPKVEARTYARKQIGRIGVLTPIFTADSVIDRLRGLVAALTELPYELVIYDVATAAQRDGYLTNLALTHQVDGLIVVFLPFDETMASRLSTHQLPVVQIVNATQPFSHRFDRIVADDTIAGRMAAEHLLARGHRRLGFVGAAHRPDFAADPGTSNLDSFRQTLALAGVPLPDAYVSLAPFGMEQARQQAHQLLDLPKPPTAIYAASDTQAIGVISAARERGLAVPDDLAVMGFDDIEIAQFIGLTTIRHQLKEQGRLAVELLLERLTGAERPARQIDMPFTLMQRAST